MRNSLKQLLKIQDKDIEILRLQEEKSALPRILESLNKELAEKNALVEKARAAAKELHLEHKKMEIELESKKQVRGKYEAQLMGVKTNQEYKALEKEIFSVKTAMSRLEDDILQKMYDMDEQQGVVKDQEAGLQAVKDRVTQKEQEIKKKIHELELFLEQLKGERETMIHDVEPSLFRRYTRILNHVRGRAIVPIIDRNCQGCHTVLPPQVLVDVRRLSELISCENCSRLLFFPEEAPPGPGSVNEEPSHPVNTAGSEPD